MMCCYPQRVALPRHVTRLYPAYNLYLYGEGVYAQETRGLKLTGAPVLFLPGNAGSYKQGKGNRAGPDRVEDKVTLVIIIIIIHYN